ncbi:uncharacterized protein LOC106663380 isoform X2 [Cimex lectularius]|nr:uncharacterized protein LOC106663380 isoform X2 [Cimex lectularius]
MIWKLKRDVRCGRVHNDVAVYLNKKFVGDEYGLLLEIQPHRIFYPLIHQFDDTTAEELMLLYGVGPGKSCVYFDLSFGNVLIGRVYFEIHSDIMPNLTRRFIQLCKNERFHFRHQLNGRFSKSEESLFDENLAWDPSLIEQSKMLEGETVNLLSYADTQIIKFLTPNLIYGGKIKNINDEWLDGEIEPEISHEEFGNLSLNMKRTRIKRQQKVHSNHFIVTLVPNPWMDKHYRCIGRVIHGHHVLTKLKDTPAMGNSPLHIVTIIDCGVLYSPILHTEGENKEIEMGKRESFVMKEYSTVVTHYCAEMSEVEQTEDSTNERKEIAFFNIDTDENVSCRQVDSHTVFYEESEITTAVYPVEYEYIEMECDHLESLGRNDQFCKAIVLHQKSEVDSLSSLEDSSDQESSSDLNIISNTSSSYVSNNVHITHLDEEITDTEDNTDLETTDNDKETLSVSEENVNDTMYLNVNTPSISPRLNQPNLRRRIIGKDIQKSIGVGSSEPDIYSIFDYEESSDVSELKPPYIARPIKDPHLMPKKVLEYIFHCVYKHHKHVKLDENIITIMQTDTFKSALAALPSPVLRSIARKMDGIAVELAEMERSVKNEEQRKIHDAVIADGVLQFTNNMVEFMVNEMIESMMPANRRNPESLHKKHREKKTL